MRKNEPIDKDNNGAIGTTDNNSYDLLLMITLVRKRNTRNQMLHTYVGRRMNEEVTDGGGRGGKKDEVK